MREKEEESSNKKVIWYLLFGFVTLVLVYLFVVMYFFYISPYDISAKLKIWPVLSTSEIGEQYAEAIVEVDFSAKEDVLDEDSTEVSIMGVNLRKDGYVLVAYQDLQYNEITSALSVITSTGAVYDGEVIFSEEAYNICIIKLTSSTEENIVLPYVKLASSSPDEGDKLVSVYTNFSTGVTQALSATYSTSGYIGYSKIIADGYLAADFMVEDCFVYEISSSVYDDAFVFDKSGNFLGFYSSYDSSDGTAIACSTWHLYQIFDSIVQTYQESQAEYQNSLASAFVGMDALEVYLHYDVMDSTYEKTEGEVTTTYSGREDYYYFKSGDSEAEYWKPVTDNMEYMIMNYYNTGGFFYLYLVEDFVYGDVTIVADSILMTVEYQGTTSTIYTKIDFLDFLYSLESGEQFTLKYETSSTSSISSVTITV